MAIDDDRICGPAESSQSFDRIIYPIRRRQIQVPYDQVGHKAKLVWTRRIGFETSARHSNDLQGKAHKKQMR
jgi:hypothetical protein